MPCRYLLLLLVWCAASTCAEAQTTVKPGTPLKGLGSVPSVAAISNDGSVLAVGCEPSVIEVWDLSTKKRTTALKSKHTGIIFVGFGSRKNELVTVHDPFEAGDSAFVTVWDMTTEKVVRTSRMPQPYTVGLVLVAGKELAGPSVSKRDVILHDIDTGKNRVLRGHYSDIQCLAASANGKTLASGDRTGVIMLWDVETGKKLKTLREHPGEVVAIQLSSDGKVLASVGALPRDEGTSTSTPSSATGSTTTGSLDDSDNDGGSWEVKIWDVLTGVDHTTIRPGVSVFSAFALSPSGRTVVITDEGGGTTGLPHVIFLDAGTGKKLLATRHESRWLLFTRDGKQLLAAGTHTKESGAEVLRWDVQEAVSDQRPKP